MKLQLDNEASLHASRYQLLCLVDENALLHQTDVKRHFPHAVQVLVKDEELEVLGACKVEEVLFAVAHAANGAAGLVKVLRLGQVLGHAKLEDGLKDAPSVLRVPDMDAFLVVASEAASILIVHDACGALIVLRILNDCALAELQPQVVLAVRSKISVRCLPAQPNVLISESSLLNRPLTRATGAFG